jgi:hypothetical protein
MNELSVLVGIESTKTLQGMPHLFKELHGKVSHFALKKLKAQYDLLPDSLEKPCTQTFRGAWGIPCSHELSNARNCTEFISADLIHDQWKLPLELAPRSYQGLVEAARAKFTRLLDLPKHSLRKLFSELDLLATNQFALVPISNPEVKIDTRGRPRASSSKRPALSQEGVQGRCKSNLELEDMHKKKRVNKCSGCRSPNH